MFDAVNKSEKQRVGLSALANQEIRMADQKALAISGLGL
jgi:hypothetical protein